MVVFQIYFGPDLVSDSLCVSAANTGSVAKEFFKIGIIALDPHGHARATILAATRFLRI